MRLQNIIAGVLPKRFFRAVNAHSSNHPDYFFNAEHFAAIDTILSTRRESIKKQGKSFDDLAGDLAILEANVFGEISEDDPKALSRKRLEALESIKGEPEQDRRAFLKVVYNTFNHGRFDQKPAFAKWVSGSSGRFAAMMIDVRTAQDMLSQHSVSIMTSHALNDTSSERSRHIRDVIEMAELTNGFVVAISKTRNELDKGFGRLFKIKTEAARVASYDGEQFDQAFEAYLDGLPARMDKIHGSNATPEDYNKWSERLAQAQTLLDQIKANQAAYAPAPKQVGNDLPAREL